MVGRLASRCASSYTGVGFDSQVLQLGRPGHDLRVLAVVGLTHSVVVKLAVRVELRVVELRVAQLGQDLLTEPAATFGD